MAKSVSSSHGFSFPNGGLLPKEEMLEVGRKPKSLVIGIPKEDHKSESRVALTPEAVEILVNNGHELIIGNEAGKGANYTNTDYSEKGAQIIKEKAEVFKADIILKISPPTADELEMMQPQQVLISSLQLTSQCREFIETLIRKRITAICFEGIKDENNYYPVTRSMSCIAGNTAVLIAAEYLSNQERGKVLCSGELQVLPPPR